LNNGTGCRSTLVLGVGNILLGDEGFGVHVVRALQKRKLADHVSAKEGGVGGFNLLGELDGFERLLVVDVMMTEHPPGYLSLFKPGADSMEPGKKIVSFHQVGVADLVQMWDFLGYKTELYFLVTRPEKIEWSTELSPTLRCAASKAVGLINDLCQNDFDSLERSQALCIH
jgi:hydrogenase maturation protease